MASADVQIDSSGTSIPLLRSRRARRSRGVKIELLVSTRNGTPGSRSALDELLRARDRVLLVHEDAVHVGEPGVDGAGFGHGTIVVHDGDVMGTSGPDRRFP